MADLALVLTATALNPNAGDLEIINGDIALTSGARAIQQDILIRLRFQLGEWFLDASQGMPYFTRILTANPESAAVQSLFRRAILSVPGVASVDRLTLALDRPSRMLSVSFAARMTSGLSFTSADFGPFVLRV